MRRIVLPALLAAALLSACRPSPPPAKTYIMQGQVLAVHADKQQVTIKHQDIPGFMPGMTMSFPVSDARLLTGREPGELVTATLEVIDATGRLTAIERVGFTPLPANSNEAAMAGAVLSEGDLVPDAAFIDQANRRRSLAEWRGGFTVLTFIYTQCPLAEFCPRMDQQFAALQRTILGEPALKDRVKLLTLSFDPERDTPAVLTAHAARLKADPAIWTFLTGDRATIDRFSGAMGIALMREADATITHNLRTFLIDPTGRISRVYSGNEWTSSTVAADLRAAVGGRRP